MLDNEGSIKYSPANLGDNDNSNNEKKKIIITKASLSQRIQSFFIIHPSQRPDILSMVLCGFFFVNTVTVCIYLINLSDFIFFKIYFVILLLFFLLVLHN